MSNLLYDALMLGRNKKVEAEEFQVAIGKKEAAHFRVSDESITISNVISDGEFSVQIFQDVPGYLEIEVYCADNFIVFDKKVLTSDDFTDGKYVFTFMVISDRLHNGRNYTSVFFRTSTQNTEISVIVENRIRVGMSDVNPRERLLKLERCFLEYMMGRMEKWQWSSSSLELLNDIPGGDELSLYLMLYKAQIYITGGDDIHAKNYIEHVGTQIPKLENKNYELYSYFVYLASLYEEVEGVVNFAVPDPAIHDDPEQQGIDPSRLAAVMDVNIYDMSAIQKVRWVFAHYPGWRILWILFYMDPYYKSSCEARLKAMEDIFYHYEGISPVMFFEAVKIYANRPSLMKLLGQFELHVLNFAVKNDYLAPEVADQAAGLICSSKDVFYSDAERQILIRILLAAYEKYSGETVLKALCHVLVAADARDSVWHPYFEKAVSTGIADDSILNYYIYTADQSDMNQLPDQVIRYFLDHTELLYEYKQYMYANIITNRFSAPEPYRESLDNIIKFAEYQMMMGQNNECLVIIYKELLEKKLLTQSMKNNLFDVVSTKEILCENDRMSSVLVFHKELKTYQESILRSGKAYIKVYSTDALILFKDFTGNIYHTIEYRINQLLPSREYIDVCIKDVAINKYMLMGDTLPILRAYKAPQEILEYFTSHKIDGQFRHEYEQELLRNTVAYYAKNSKDAGVYDELLKFRDYDLPAATRGLLIDIMMRRGLTKEAFDEIREYGMCDLPGKSLGELAHAYIDLNGPEEDDLLTALCEAGYGENGFDENIFDYLYRYYNGRMDLMVDLFRACNAYKRPAAVIEERILNKAIRTGEHPAAVSYVFQKYCEEGEDTDLMVKYMEFRAGIFLYDIMNGAPAREGTTDLSFFNRMESDMMKGVLFDDNSQIAYLLYRISLESPSDRQIRNMEHCLKDLVRRGKMLEEFKYYKKYFDLPSTLANNIIVSAFSENAEQKPFIAYEICGPAGVRSGVEEMEEIFPRCYVKYFTLFYGEKVTFTMDGQTSSDILYSDMDIQKDGSRYALLDDIIRYKEHNDTENFEKAAGDYYLKGKLAELLF